MVKMGDFGLFVACWGGKCFIARVCVWCWGGKCFTARLGVLCWGVVSFVPVMVPRLVREKILPARLVGDKSGTKLSQQEENAPNGAILGEQGEFYTENAAARLVQGEFYTDNAAARLAWGEFCTGTGGMWRVLGEFFRATRRCTLVLSATRRRPCRRVWGFCSIRSWLAACRRRVRSLMMQFPRRTAVSPRLEVLWSLNRKPPR